MFRHGSYDFISRCLWTHPGFVGRSFRAPVLVRRDVDIMASTPLLTGSKTNVIKAYEYQLTSD